MPPGGALRVRLAGGESTQTRHRERHKHGHRLSPSPSSSLAPRKLREVTSQLRSWAVVPIYLAHAFAKNPNKSLRPRHEGQISPSQSVSDLAPSPTCLQGGAASITSLVAAHAVWRNEKEEPHPLPFNQRHNRHPAREPVGPSGSAPQDSPRPIPERGAFPESWQSHLYSPKALAKGAQDGRADP